MIAKVFILSGICDERSDLDANKQWSNVFELKDYLAFILRNKIALNL